MNRYRSIFGTLSVFRSAGTVGALILVVAALASACGSDADGPAAEAPSLTSLSPVSTSETAAAPTTALTELATTSPPPTTSQPSAPATTVAPEMIPVVGVATEIFVDESRPTNAVEGLVDAASSRTLPTMVWYPALVPADSTGADEGRDDEPVADAEPDTDGGPYPLIELSHGLTSYARDMAPLASVLAASGYVVVSPDFPETTGGIDFAAFPNFVHQPEDVIFTIDSILGLNDDPGSRYHGLIDGDRIGIGGRSLGATTSLLTAYNTRHGDPRVRAVFSAAGLELPVEGGAFEYGGRPPLLVVHGDADPLVGYAKGQEIYAHAGTPRYFLTLKGQGHVTYFDGADPYFEVFSTSVLAFFEEHVKGDSATGLPLTFDDDRIRIEGVAS